KHFVVILQGYTPIWISIHAILIVMWWKELRRRALIRNRLFPKWSFVLPKKIWVKTMIHAKHMWVINWLALVCRDWKNSPAHDSLLSSDAAGWSIRYRFLFIQEAVYSLPDLYAGCCSVNCGLKDIMD